MIGKTVAHYRILEKLGEGGMGVVYLAEDSKLGRKVALKALAAERAGDPLRRQRFIMEARAAAALSHSGIAAVYALEEVGEELYIAFEYVKGQSLRAMVAPGGLELDALLHMAAGIADALAAAHALGIVHRDLKPENILRTAEGQTKILDFGLARFMRPQEAETASVQLTSAGTIVGTVSYMSPEQLEGMELDFRSDIFAFGVLVYELATGVRPFDGATSSSTISRILTAEPVPLVQRNPVAPPELDRIVRKCLRKRREERYQSTRDLAVDLESLSREGSGTASAPSATAEESAFLRQESLLASTSPRRWWEIHEIVQTIIAVLVIYLGWLATEHTKATWLFVTLLVFSAGAASLRIYLLGMAIIGPAVLQKEERRLSRWVDGTTLGTVLVLFILGGWLMRGHLGLAALLIGVGMGGTVLVFLIEPAIRRTVFLSSTAMALHDAKRAAQASLLRDQHLIAAIQLLYVLPAAYGFFSAGPEIQRIIQALSTGTEAAWMPRPQAITMLVGMGVLLIGIFACATVAIGIWLGRPRAVRVFDRWFYVFLFFDLPAMAGIIGVTVWFSNAAVASFLFPFLVALPLYQRSLARRILSQESAGSGE
jgi:tRNA A-37 threonylcarbamoyl transferase component Bud32